MDHEGQAMSAPVTTEHRPGLWGRLTRGFRRLRSTPDWEAVAGDDWPARIMTELVTDRLHEKQGRSIARWTLEREDRRAVVYLKRHYRLPRWRGLLASLWPRRAWSPGLQEWNNLRWASSLGLPVPRAMAAGELLGSGLRLQSFLAVEELTDMLPLHEAIPDAAEQLPPLRFAAWKRGLIVELARLVREVHRRSIFHKDLYLCHFYIPQSTIEKPPIDWRDAVWMIDLHRLATHRFTHAWWLIKDLAQFLYSSAVTGITDRDRLWFWRCYWGDRRALRGRIVQRCVRAKARLYQRHNRKDGF